MKVRTLKRTKHRNPNFVHFLRARTWARRCLLKMIKNSQYGRFGAPVLPELTYHEPD